jgi:sulfur relay (sulfurtransferase) complex TusBCD TusD component (DsrE family)
MEMTEDKLQSDCYQWFHSTYPELRGLLCYNLNNSRNKIRAMMDKGMGLQKGRSDLVFYYSGSACMIEMKTENGKQTPEQKKWQEIVEKNGFEYTICKTLEQFQAIIKSKLLDLNK